MAANPQEVDELIPDMDQAERFLKLLDPEAEAFTFQGFDDQKKGREELVFTRHGPLATHAAFMAQANQRKGYVGVMVQEGDGITHKGKKSCRTIANVKRIRAIFQEDDGDGKELPLEPHIVVESSPGKHHRYLLCEGLSGDDFAAVMDVMVDHYGSDKNAKDLARVLRIPGFYHQKDEPFMVRLVGESGALPYTRDQVLEAFQIDHSTIGHKERPQSHQERPHGPQDLTQQASIRIQHLALQAAQRTLDDVSLGRNKAIYQLGCHMRRDGLPGTGAAFQLALKTFEANMRPTNTSGEIMPMDWDNEAKAISMAYHAPSEPDRPGTHWSDQVEVNFDYGSANDDDQHQNEPVKADDPFPEPFPGFMADVVGKAIQSAVMPQPRLTELAVLIGMSSSICGRYKLPCGMRLNLYGVGVADTGTGKDHPQAVAQAIVKAAGQRIIGKPSSGQGLEDCLEDYAATFVTIDEIAHLFEAINGSNKMPYLIELASILLRLFSSSRGTYHGRVLAKCKGMQQYRNIEHPCVNLLGFATPQKLGEVLTIGNLEDGLAGRLLFAEGLPDVAPRRSMQSFELGDRHADASAVGNFTFLEGAGHEYQINVERVVQITPEADAELDRLMQTFHEAKLQPSVSAHAKALYARSFEKAYRVAGVLSVFDDPKSPTITAEHVRWAEQLVKASNCCMVEFVTKHMHGNKIQIDAAKVKEVMLKIMSGKIRPVKVSWKRYLPDYVVRSWALKASHLDKRSFDFAVEHLEALDEVQSIEGKPQPMPTPSLLMLGGKS